MHAAVPAGGMFGHSYALRLSHIPQQRRYSLKNLPDHAAVLPP